MSEQQISKKWLARIMYDLDTAKAMLQTGRLIYAVIMCQQSLGKMLEGSSGFPGERDYSNS
jgi:HEPN domain-containing protein